MPDLIDGRYQIIDVIASGGMATVWRTHDTRLDRPVALKRPHPAPPGDGRLLRFEREARAAAALSHPHLVTVHDVGHDDEGPYLVMELIDGPTLAEAAPSLDRREALELIASIAEALATIHAAGIVHRDIKPANILISDRGPKLTDFGVALDPDTDDRLTTPGTVFATPRYAAPEQLGGEEVTAAGDVFSLGAVLYELVGGELPFGEDRSLPLAPVGDEALDRLLGRALAIEPADRPNAAEFAASLRGVLPTVPVVAGRGDTRRLASTAPATQVRTESRATRRLIMGAAGGMALLLTLAVAVLNWGQPEQETATTAGATTVPLTTGLPTTAPPSTAPPTTVAPTTVVSATTAPASSQPAEIDAARQELESVLEEIPPPELVPPDRRAMLASADTAIEAARDGRLDQAADALEQIAVDLDEKVGNEADIGPALEALDRLSRALGIE